MDRHPVAKFALLYSLGAGTAVEVPDDQLFIQLVVSRPD